MPDTSTTPVSDDDGFGAAEALVATALTLVVVLGALGTFRDAWQLTELARRTAGTNQELQSALSLMVRDAMQTGQGIPIGGVPVPSGDGVAALPRPAPPGSTLTFAAGAEVLPAVSPGGSLGPSIGGRQTDILTLLMADPTLPLSEWPLESVGADGASAVVDARTPIGGPDAISAGDVVLFSSALGNALQTVTGTSGQTMFFDQGDGLGLNQRSAPQGTLLNLQSSPGVFPPMTATRVVLISYYLDVVTDPDLPRLVRQRNMGPRLAIALGVDDLQVTFDVIDGATNPSNIDILVPPQSPHQIRLISLQLTGHAREGATPASQPYTQTVATRVGLRSLSFLDRYR
jgi:hypothetical protein